jgi:hypothetical protein
LCLYQRDFDGTILFQHRTGAKWRYAGAQDDLPNFAGTEACGEGLRNLRSNWNGLVFHAPPRSADVSRIEEDIARQSSFIFVIRGRSPERLELWPDGEIGAGAAADRRNWYCADANGGLQLFLCDAFGPRWRFERQTGGRWYGKSIEDAAIEAYVAADTCGGKTVPESVRRPISIPPYGEFFYSKRDDAGS